MAKMIHSMIRVLDEARSLAFYKAAFGLEPVERLDFDSFTLVYLANAESSFELELTINKGREEAYDLGNGYGHLAVSVEDVADRLGAEVEDVISVLEVIQSFEPSGVAARNLAEWIEAMKLQALPSINYIYADKQGNIAYVYNAQFPDRKEGPDWSGVLPGDDSSLIWKDYVPFDLVPKLYNPNAGYLYNANNTPFRATAANDNLKPADFPERMGIQTDMTNRAMRIEETYGEDRSITRDAFHAYKYDLAYSEHSRMAEIVAEILALDAQGDTDIAAAQDILRNWDRRTDVGNRGAALAVVAAEPIVRAELRHETPPATLDRLTDTISHLKTHFGRLDPEWGEVNRFRRGEVDLPVDGGPDILRAIYGFPVEDGTLTAQGGDTLIMFVEWDRSGNLRSQSIHPFGSATLDRSSPHYADQAPLFVGMQVKPVRFTREELEPNVKESYRPGER